MINNPSPLIIFAYNRHDEIVATIDALKENYLADQTDVYVFSDKERALKDRENVTKVREYLDVVDCGFKSFTVIKRKENYGLAKNVIEGVTEIIDNYGKVIVLEDDLVTSKNFLCYMNYALEFYKDQNSIFSISGYSGVLPSLKNYKYDSYLSYRPSSWGWATWKEEWSGIDWSVIDFNEFVENKKEVNKFNRGGIDMTRMLRHQRKGKNNSWAIRWSYAMHKKDRFCIYPKDSKVQNIGFGKDATHCSGMNIYQTELDDSNNCNFKFISSLKPDNQIARDFRYQFSYTNKLIKRTRLWVQSLF